MRRYCSLASAAVVLALLSVWMAVPAFAQDAHPQMPDAAAATMPDGGTAVVAPVITPPSPDQGEAFLKQIFDAAMKKDYMGLTALVLIAAVWLVRKFGAKKIPFLATDRGGAILVMVASILGALANSLAAGKGYSSDVLLHSVYLGFMAAGGWVWIRKMLGVKSEATTPAPSA